MSKIYTVCKLHLSQGIKFGFFPLQLLSINNVSVGQKIFDVRINHLTKFLNRSDGIIGKFLLSQGSELCSCILFRSDAMVSFSRIPLVSQSVEKSYDQRWLVAAVDFFGRVKG